jgi:hypothetical protein
MVDQRRTPWTDVFTITNTGHSPSAEHGIWLQQVQTKEFLLGSTVRFTGAKTGLEGRIPDSAIAVIREVTPDNIAGPGETPRSTDLASVPTVLQWLVSRYGVHTPAALVHDRFIGMAKDEKQAIGVEDLHDAYTDRYFRFMLEALGVRWLRRWMMWAAVAMRTRWASGWTRRIMMIIWLVGSVAGIGLAVAGIATGHWWWLGIASVAPLGFGLLWDRQYGAGLVAAYTAIWVLPPTVLGAVGYVIYRGLEGFAGLFRKRATADETHPPTFDEF